MQNNLVEILLNMQLSDGVVLLVDETTDDADCK